MVYCHVLITRPSTNKSGRRHSRIQTTTVWLAVAYLDSQRVGILPRKATNLVSNATHCVHDSDGLKWPS